VKNIFNITRNTGIQIDDGTDSLAYELYLRLWQSEAVNK
jgi:hypothetical protein